MKKTKKNLATLLTMGVLVGQAGSVMAMDTSIMLDKVTSIEQSINETKETYTRKMVDVNGEKMSYFQLGDPNSKKDIIIIHGSTFTAKGMIPYGELYAAKGYNVIIVDTAGHYTGTNTVAKNDIDVLSDNIADFIKTLKNEKVVKQKVEIQGWSLGGTVAMNIAARHKNLVSSVGVINGSSDYLDSVFDAYANDEEKIEHLVGGFKKIPNPSPLIQAIIDNPDEYLAPYEACNADYEIDNIVNIDAILEDINVPVYIYFDEYDNLSTLAQQQKMNSLMKKSKLYSDKAYGHINVLQVPERVFNVIEGMKDK